MALTPRQKIGLLIQDCRVLADKYGTTLPCDCDLDYLCDWCRFVDTFDMVTGQKTRRAP